MTSAPHNPPVEKAAAIKGESGCRKRKADRNLMTPDIAWATAATFVDGTAIAPRHWDDEDEKYETFWARFTDLLGNPPEEEVLGMLADYRDEIARIELMRLVFARDGSARLDCFMSEGPDNRRRGRDNDAT